MLTRLKSRYIEAINTYYHDPDGNTLMSDSEFDRLEAKIKKLDPDWSELHKTHGGKKTDIPLEHYMPSLNKKYAQDVEGFVPESDTSLYMVKYDGTSLQLTYDAGVPVRLVTRGRDGIMGGDVSFLIPFLNIPKTIPRKKRTVFRCEAIIRKSLFAAKYASTYKTARAAVNGQFNRTLANADKNVLRDVTIIVLGVYGAKVKQLPDICRKYGLSHADSLYAPNPSRYSAEAMDRLLDSFLRNLDYEADGIVIAEAERIYDYQDSANPTWAWAYKRNQEYVEAKVIDVIWQVSANRRMTPKIKIEPVDMGVSVEHATLHNAEWMMTRRVGPGAIVQLEMAGDVIPKIVGVTKPAKKPKLPDTETYWKGVHLYKKGYTKQAQVLTMLQFFRGIGVEHVADKGLSALYDLGITRISLLMQLKPNELVKVLQQSLGKANGQKVAKQYMEIMYKDGIHFDNLLAAVRVFGEGVDVKTLAHLRAAIKNRELVAMTTDMSPGDFEGSQYIGPIKNITNQSMRVTADDFRGIKNIGPKTIKLLVAGMPNIVTLLRVAHKAKIKILYDAHTTVEATDNKYAGIHAAWTGYRSREQETAILMGGGTIGGISSKTTHLFYNPNGKFMAKVRDAAALGVKTLVWQEFTKE